MSLGQTDEYGGLGCVPDNPKSCFSMRLALTCLVPFSQRLAHLCIRLLPSDSPIALDRPDPQFRLWSALHMFPQQ